MEVVPHEYESTVVSVEGVQECRNDDVLDEWRPTLQLPLGLGHQIGLHRLERLDHVAPEQQRWRTSTVTQPLDPPIRAWLPSSADVTRLLGRWSWCQR